MRSIVIAVLVLGVIGCSSTYPSRKQAYEACKQWAKKEMLLDVDRITIGKRICSAENETRQFLGEQKQKIKGEGISSTRYKVYKNFRY